MRSQIILVTRKGTDRRFFDQNQKRSVRRRQRIRRQTMVYMEMKPITRALEFVRAPAGICAAAIERGTVFAQANFVAERGLHDLLKEVAVRV